MSLKLDVSLPLLFKYEYHADELLRNPYDYVDLRIATPMLT